MTINLPDNDALTRVTFAARAEAYARGVVSGAIVAGKFIKAACQRHLDDLDRAEADPSSPWIFDPIAAGKPCHFLQLLPHIKGEWAKAKVVDGYVQRSTIRLEEWQVFYVAVQFGWVNRVTGLRRFRRSYLEVARKNAKSTLAAGLALYMLGPDKEPGAEVYSAATKKDQARIVWDVAAQMIRMQPDFRTMLGIEASARAIFQTRSNSKYEALGRDSDSLDGLNTHCFISDELHAQKDRGIYDVLDSSTGARSQPLGIGITTAGYDETGICYEQRSYLVRILNTTLHRHGGMGFRIEGDAIEDDTYFGLIYTIDTGYADGTPDDDWSDEAHWPKANPNLGVSVSIDDMRAKAAKAKASTQSQPEFRTKHCNQWLAADTAWMDMAKWRACGDPTLREEDFAGEPCWSALDAAFKTDVFAKVKVFRRGEHYYCFGRYWLPESKCDARDNPQFWAWVQQGLITEHPGDVIDIRDVATALKHDRDLHDLREVPYDPAQLTQFSAEQIEEGMPMVEMRPLVLNFSEPMKAISELVLTGKFHHNGDPVLSWMVSNVVCHRDAKDNIYPRKPEGQEDKRKIDGVIALIMALGRARIAAPKNTIGDDYELVTV